MRPVSNRLRRRDRHYPDQRHKVYERAGGRCEAQVSDRCTFRCEQVHHIAGREGPDPHRLDNLLGVCLPCHDWIGGNHDAARRLGFVRSRLGKVGQFTGGAA